MKNLYKIENEVYIVSNTENVNENCWIIVDDRLVQVSYLLSDEVARGNKVILTTNKLLIKDGVQAIPDDFLEWFVKNPSCESVEFENDYLLWKKSEKEKLSDCYKIIIQKEEPKQQTLEEAAKKYSHDMRYEYDSGIRSFTDGAKWMQERMYSEKEVYELLNNFNKHTLQLQKLKLGNSFNIRDWFEQFKKK